MQHIIEYGGLAHKQCLYEVLAGDLAGFARHRIASHVVERALDSSNPMVSALLAEEALRDPQALVTLACNRQSQFVVRRLLNLPTPQGEAVRAVLHADLTQLQSSKYGSRIVDALAAQAASKAGA